MTTEYELSKHRFYELKHFCMQYGQWQLLYVKLDGWQSEIGKNNGDTTSHYGIQRADLMRNMLLVSDTCHDVCGNYAQEVFELVTQGIKPELRWDQKDFWYYYRKFFWELSKRRG